MTYWDEPTPEEMVVTLSERLAADKVQAALMVLSMAARSVGGMSVDFSNVTGWRKIGYDHARQERWLDESGFITRHGREALKSARDGAARAKVIDGDGRRKSLESSGG